MTCLIPVGLKVAEGIRRFVVDGYDAWRLVRIGQGVKPGQKAIPQVSHPDIAKSYDELPEDVKRWLTSMAILRLQMFRELPASDLEELLAFGHGTGPLSTELQERIAIQFHNIWWTLRRANGQTGHTGDKPWEEETDAEKANDLALVPDLAVLLAIYESSDDPEKRDLIAFIKGEIG